MKRAVLYTGKIEIKSKDLAKLLESERRAAVQEEARS